MGGEADKAAVVTAGVEEKVKEVTRALRSIRSCGRLDWNQACAHEVRHTTTNIYEQNTNVWVVFG